MQNVGQDVDFICGDNCATNDKLATEILRQILHYDGRTYAWKVPFVGCNSHRFNFAWQDYYAQPSVASVIVKVVNLMRDLRSLKNASKLKNWNLREETWCGGARPTACYWSKIIASIHISRAPWAKSWVIDALSNLMYGTILSILHNDNNCANY